MAIVAAVVTLGSQPAAAQALGGSYRGLGAAEGYAITLQPSEDGFDASFSDASGTTQTFLADKLGDRAQGVIDVDGMPAIIRIEPTRYGVKALIFPIDDRNQMRLDLAVEYVFARPGVKLPEVPEGFVKPPTRLDERLAGNSFLASWEFWPPNAVRDGYMMLTPRDRTLIKLFPMIQLDIIWKLCSANNANDALAVALRGQGVNCTEVLSGFESLRARGRFDAYKAEVAKTRRILRQQMRCADFYVESKAACDGAAREVAKAATSLETAATVLDRYR